MNPLISVIVPVFNGAAHLAETIQSVLDQSYKNFELITVNDASSDGSVEIVRRYEDTRIRYLEHTTNKGANAARNTGIRASRGNILAFLDQDDLYHRDKLRSHVSFLESRPEIGFSYNARFELNHSSKTIREIFRPPTELSLADLVLGYPMTPSEMVVRKSWIERVGLWNDSPVVNGAEIILTGLLFLAGCRFGCLNRALNYRRRYSGRRFSNLEIKCESEQEAREIIYRDPRCPPEVAQLRDQSFSDNSLSFALLAFAQNETALGRKLLENAIRLNPHLRSDRDGSFLKILLHFSLLDETVGHEAILKHIYQQLPDEILPSQQEYRKAVGLGYLLRGARAVIYNGPDAGRDHFSKAEKMNCPMEEYFFSWTTAHLLSFEAEFGSNSVGEILQSLKNHIEAIGGNKNKRRFSGCYSINSAFASYRAKRFKEVPGKVIRAVANDSGYMANRGVAAILIKSLARILKT